MKFVIRHEIKGRIRVQVIQKGMTFEQADTLQYYLNKQENVITAKVRRRTSGVIICYQGRREAVIRLLKSFRYENVKVPEAVLESSGRKLDEEYWERLVTKAALRAGSKLFLPYPVRAHSLYSYYKRFLAKTQLFCAHLRVFDSDYCTHSILGRFLSSPLLLFLCSIDYFHISYLRKNLYILCCHSIYRIYRCLII